jgi:choline O-acetyltransferase
MFPFDMSFIHSDKKNRQNLELIENALLVVCFDDPLPASFNCRTLRSDVPVAVRGHVVDSRDETNMAHQMIHGGGSAANSANRWFDMTIQVRAPLTIKVIITVEYSCTEFQSLV